MIKSVAILLIFIILVVDAQNSRCATCTNLPDTEIIKVTNTYNNTNGCKVIEQTCVKTGCVVKAQVLNKATRAVLADFADAASKYSVEMVCGQDPNSNSYSYLYNGTVATFSCTPFCMSGGGESGNVEDNFTDSTSTESTSPASTSTESTSPCVESTTTEEPSTSTVVTTTTTEPSTSQPDHGCHAQKKKK